MGVFKEGYSPTQLLDFAKINPFEDGYHSREKKDCLVANILAIVVTEKDPKKLQEKIGKEIIKYSNVSIGQALEKLHTIATCPAELDGGCDGLDALTYHLAGHSCTTGIADLQAVLKRFDDDAKKLDAERMEAERLRERNRLMNEAWRESR